MLFSEFRAIIDNAPGRHEFYAIYKPSKLNLIGILKNDSPLLEALDDEEISYICPSETLEIGNLEICKACPCIEVVLLEDKVID